MRILNCLADAGGRPWMKESFHVGFNVQGDAPRRLFAKTEEPWASEHDITFVNCVARNCIYSEGRYWQGDGYCAERGITNLVFINCAAFDSRRYGATTGYDSARTALWRARPAAELAEVARDLVKHQGWEDLKRRIETVSTPR